MDVQACSVTSSRVWRPQTFYFLNVVEHISVLERVESCGRCVEMFRWVVNVKVISLEYQDLRSLSKTFHSNDTTDALHVTCRGFFNFGVWSLSVNLQKVQVPVKCHFLICALKLYPVRVHTESLGIF